MKNFLKLLILLVVGLAFSTTAWGQLLFEENFDYPAGDSLNVLHGWTVQPTASYVNPIKVVSPGLTYTNYPSVVGNGVHVDTTGQDIYNTFTSQTSGSLYASFLVNITKATTTGDYFIHFTESAGSTTFRGRVFARLSGSDVVFGLLKGSTGTAAYTATTYAMNTTHLVVLKYTFNTGSTTDDSVYLFVNPTIGSAEPTPDLSYGSTDVDFTGCVAINLRQGTAANAPRSTVDGIRVGTSWAAIFPPQLIDVTFQLNMRVKILETYFDPTTEVVRAVGTIQTPNWSPETAPDMVDPNNDSIYTITYRMPANASYEYKYNIGTSWAGKDENTGNRSLTIGATDTTLPVVYFNNDEIVTPPVTDSANVTFQINMRVKILETYYDPTTEVVTVPGDFNNWLNEPPANDTKTLSDLDGDSIYTKIIRMPANATYNYKYAVGLTWGKDESTGNRSFTIGTTDTTLPVVYFNNDEIVNPPSGDSVNITFQVNMKVKAKEGYFNPATDVVTVPGGFNNWLNEPPANDTKTLDDPNNDSIYTKTMRIPTNSTYEYKYNIGLGWDGKDEPTGNRQLVVGTTDMILDPVWFANDSIVTLTGNGNIMFQIDMSVMAEIGIYDPSIDKLQVRGGFNGWSGSDTARSHLNQDFADPNLWFLDVPFTNVGINETQSYKYFVDLQTPGIWTDGWERPCSRGGGNREVAFLAQPNQVVPLVYYDDIHPEWVIETGKNIQATFRVDMRPAMDLLLQAIPFNPALDTVYWLGEQPSFIRSQGWTDSDEMRVLTLTDPDGDSIYTGTMSIKAPSFNSFVYRYAYVSGTDATWYREPSGFAAFAYRVRYIGQDVARSFPVNPWTMPVDTWTNKEIKPDQETDPYTSYLGVTDEDLIASEYQLYQNYPNPFNPSTTIRFSIVNKSPVMLKVYNLLGQEIAILVDEVLNPGTYKVNFDGSKLASGLYFYRINANNYTETKKMMFVK